MNKKVKKFVIPALAATIMTGGVFAATSAHASTFAKDKPVKQEVQNEQQESANLAKLAKITEAESKTIALQKVPGTVTDVELENEDGTVVYGVEVQAKDGSKQDVKVNAQTGEIVKVDNGEENEKGQEANDKEVNDDQKVKGQEANDKEVNDDQKVKGQEANDKEVNDDQKANVQEANDKEVNDDQKANVQEANDKEVNDDQKVKGQEANDKEVNDDQVVNGQAQNDNDAEVND